MLLYRGGKDLEKAIGEAREASSRVPTLPAKAKQKFLEGEGRFHGCLDFRCDSGVSRGSECLGNLQDDCFGHLCVCENLYKFVRMFKEGFPDVGGAKIGRF